MCTSWHDVCLGWRLWLRPTIILLYALFVIIVLPLLIINTVKDGFTKKKQLILIGGMLVFTTLPICIWHIMQHIYHFTKPILQKPIIRILWMVPIYALNAVSGLLYYAYITIVSYKIVDIKWMCFVYRMWSSINLRYCHYVMIHECMPMFRRTRSWKNTQICLSILSANIWMKLINICWVTDVLFSAFLIHSGLA